MESYEVLQKAIPELQSPKVAKFLGISANYVNRWRRRPSDDEEPTATGQRSILDRITDLIDVVFLINPSGSGLIIQYIDAHHDNLLTTHAKPIPCRDTQARTGAILLSEAVEAVNSLHVDGCTPETLQQLVQLRDASEYAIKQVEKTLNQEAAAHGRG
ncbi:MAG: hypothetical protein IPG22_16460 [Acidobacteria bacterium]|nr:hypothetical protein [Acidobacteriota bacterium]